MESLLILTLLSSFVISGVGSTPDEPSYEDTRALLLKLETVPANGALRTLFREASRRRNSLLRALDDPEHQVQVNALLVIDYVALPELTDGLTTWLKSISGTDRAYRRRNIDPIDAELAGRTFRGNPADVTRRHLFGNRQGSYRMVAQSKEAGAVLVEIVFGETFTEGWHVVLRKEGSKWRPILKTNVWVS